MKYDYIVIGSGVSGLTCASGLSLMDKKVLLIEKNEETGGCMRNIVWEELKEGQKKGEGIVRGNWTMGMQFTVAYGPDSIYNKLLQIFTDDKCKFSPMDVDYQKIKFYNWAGKPGDVNPPPTDFFDYTIKADSKKMRAAMIADYPEEKRAIKRYYRNMNAISRFAPLLAIPKWMPIFLARIFHPIILGVFFPVMSIRLRKLNEITLTEVVENRYKIKSPEVRAIIYSYWHLEGMAVKDVPFIYYVVGTKMLEKGVYIPNGGATKIRDAFVETIKKNGVDIRVNTTVEKIIIENNKAVGVELIGGEVIESKNVISSAGIPETIGGLIDRGDWNKRITSIMAESQKMKNYRSGLVLRVGLKGDISKLGFTKATLKTQIGESSTLIGNPTEKDWLPQDITYSFLSVIDKTVLNANGYTAVDVICFCPYECFEYLYPIEKNQEEYDKVVARITEILIDSFEKEYPGVKEMVAFTYLTSPLTVEANTSHIKGNIDGLNMKKSGLMNIQPHTGIKNLYFSGMDMFSQGITTFDGILTIAASEGLLKTTWKLWRKWRKIKKARV
ncbi:MAG: all-trans-retinol 13,14-reductase [Arenicella sp.]|jgi:all-trans-retinol 13,14-reductase